MLVLFNLVWVESLWWYLEQRVRRHDEPPLESETTAIFNKILFMIINRKGGFV